MKCLGTVRSTKNSVLTCAPLRCIILARVFHWCVGIQAAGDVSKEDKTLIFQDFKEMQRIHLIPKNFTFIPVIQYNNNIIWGCWSFSKPRIFCWLFLVPSYRKPETQEAAAWNIQEHFVQIKRGKVQGIKELLKIVRLRGDMTWYDLDNWNIMEY